LHKTKCHKKYLQILLLFSTFQIKTQDDKSNLYANKKLNQRLNGFLEPNQCNPLLSLLDIEKTPMVIPKNLQQIPIVVNQGQPNDRPICPFILIY
jgi:hypothetical protein